MQVSLEGKVALVTGASKGIGRAVAERFLEAGAQVMLTSRKHDQLAAAADELGEGVAVMAGNAGDPQHAAACVAATIERFGGLDVLVNNAATNAHYGPLVDADDAGLDKTMRVNLYGPLHWCRAAHAAAFVRRPGVIVNVASVGGLRVERATGVYNMSKAALIHLTRHLAAELGPTRVVGVAPGLVRTDFSTALVDRFGDRLAERLPLGRLGEPDDVAKLVTFLASDAASWITGETYVVDGGAGVSA